MNTFVLLCIYVDVDFLDTNESKSHLFLSSFFLHFLESKSYLMKNYGIFTQICVLQGFNAKEPKTNKKGRKKWLRQKMKIVATLLKYIRTKVQDS